MIKAKGLLSMNPQHIRQQLYKLVKSRMALSAIVTTLIVLVISVLLAGVVSYFAINVTSTRVQEENLVISRRHVWFDEDDGAQAAIMVVNTGGRDAAVGKLTVRGQTVEWSKVYFALIEDTIKDDISYKAGLVDGVHITVGGKDTAFTQASDSVTVQTGQTLIIYLKNPDSISVNDVGLTVSVNVFTSQAMYYKETNVETASNQELIG
jgi:hypothetical protein